MKYKCGRACSMQLTALALMVTGIRDFTLYILINIMYCLVLCHSTMLLIAANAVYV